METKGPCNLLPRGNDIKIAKIHLRKLEIFFPRSVDFPDSCHLLGQHFVGSIVASPLQMTVAHEHFAHVAHVIANGKFDVGPMPLAQQALHI